MVVALAQAIKSASVKPRRGPSSASFSIFQPMAAAAGILHLEHQLFLADENPQIDQIPRPHAVDAQQAGRRMENRALRDRSAQNKMATTAGCAANEPASAEARLDTGGKAHFHTDRWLRGLQFGAEWPLLHPDQQDKPKPACSRRNNQVLWVWRKRSHQGDRQPGHHRRRAIPTSIGTGTRTASSGKSRPQLHQPEARLMAGIPSREGENGRRRHAASHRIKTPITCCPNGRRGDHRQKPGGHAHQGPIDGLTLGQVPTPAPNAFARAKQQGHHDRNDGASSVFPRRAEVSIARPRSLIASPATQIGRVAISIGLASPS